MLRVFELRTWRVWV
ncbi:hypothetical protein CFP56_025906 [Quercus suber]|uniref:Uncharacterized protein n=1 Tax=Quercus suber TaxID=58331 RepID=A0AAW0LWG7_QUESU